MAVAHTTVLELLGKQVSFTYSYDTDLITYSSTHSGIVVEVIISLSGSHHISIGSDFYPISDLMDFKII